MNRAIAHSLWLCWAAMPLRTYAGQSLEVWMRAFIPNKANAGPAANFIIPVKNAVSGSAVRLIPVDTNMQPCFATDDRGISSDGSASSRIETKFTIEPNDDVTAATVLPASGRTTASVTTQVDCQSGATVEAKQASVDRDVIGKPSAADGYVQVIGQVTGTNKIPLAGNGPSIDYSFDLKWHPRTGVLDASINVGSFPAFEAYARLKGGEWVLILKHLPTGNPWSLMGDPWGIAYERVQTSTTLPVLAGVWKSTDADQRFTVEIKDKRATWTERTAGGNALTRDVELQSTSDGYRISRPNDDQVLAFIGFQPALRAEILARSPKPSFMDLRLQSPTLTGNWYGLLVIKDDHAHLKELVQPGTRPPKPFQFQK